MMIPPPVSPLGGSVRLHNQYLQRGRGELYAFKQ